MLAMIQLSTAQRVSVIPQVCIKSWGLANNVYHRVYNRITHTATKTATRLSVRARAAPTPLFSTQTEHAVRLVQTSPIPPPMTAWTLVRTM
jgi:hypothetical protein